MTTPPFQPQPCEGGGTGADAVDVEQMLLCDTLPDGTVVGTALAVYEYDAAGAPTGSPTFVDPATGNPYVAQGTLMPCPGETGCLEPVAFHRTTTATGPVDHPGRQYDITLPINPGFAVQSLQVDQVTSPANIVWDVADPDGEQFRQDLAAFIDARVPAAATVTITNPNAGNTICGTAAPMQIHIECLRLDQSPPDLIELIYNGGQDMVINPAYNETPPLNPPVSQGNYGFHLLGRQDNNVYPGNPPANRANCTNVANRGWETNDVGRTFEIWGQDIVNGSNVTPTPRGTPVQEMTSDGPPPGGRSTIWQTFQAPASANFIIRVVHGARDAGENHRITLDNGDTDAAQNGDLIDDNTTNVGVVTNSAGGPGPWTQFSQTIPLTGGNTYTLALSTNNPAGGARGGLFTDMRAYIDRPDLRATATTDDDTCVVTVDETTTACQDELWSPICEAGTIHSWQNAETGAVLANAAFWGQAPAPTPGPCPAPAGSGGGGSVAANLVHTYPVCATVGGVRTNLQRVVITDPSGGVLADSFIGPDGGPVATPSSFAIGSCTDTAFMGDVVLCDDNGPFLRKYVQTVDDLGRPQVRTHGDFTLAGAAYTPVGAVGTCGGEATLGGICFTDPVTSLPRQGFLTRDADGTAHVYTLSGVEVTPFPTILICAQTSYFEEILCDQGNAGHQFIRRYTGSPVAGTNDTLWDLELDGLTDYVPVGPVGTCDSGCDPVTTTGLCLADGTPIGVVTRRDCGTGAVVQDGWINLLTGAFSAGPPPAGTVACGTSQSVQVSGTFCDVDGLGAVHGLVLIEYHYAADGTIESVRLVDATTGTTYVPVGTVTICPADVEQPDADLVILCDVQPGGTVVPFVRDYRRDQNNVVTGFTNYTLAGAAYVPTGTVGTCPGGPEQADSELLSLCDDAGVFQRRLSFDAAGNLLGTADFTLAGVPYVPVGAVTYGCTDPTAIAQVYGVCADVPRSQFAVGPNLLENGHFERSTGQGLQSFVGPGWTTSYTACGPDLFAGPCGASTWSFFTTTAAQVMSSGANAVPAQGSRSFAVNVGPNVNIPIIQWQAVYLENGKTYELSADAAVVFGPYSVAVKIGGSAAPGGLFPLSTPPTGNWGKTTATFTYAGTTGFTQVGLYSNTGAAGGNDHVFDNFELHEISAASAGTQTPRVYSGTQRAVIEQIVQTAGCNDDRRDALLGHIADAVTPQEGANLDSTVQRQTGAGNIVIATKPRSVTLVVLAGTVNLNLGTTLAQSIPAGVTLTWAVDGPGESLVDTFTFAGVAGSDFIVTTTRQ